jgi:hypothetical protein
VFGNGSHKYVVSLFSVFFRTAAFRKNTCMMVMSGSILTSVAKRKIIFTQAKRCCRLNIPLTGLPVLIGRIDVSLFSKMMQP